MPILPSEIFPISTRDIIGITDASEAGRGRLGQFFSVNTNGAKNFAESVAYRDMDTLSGAGALPLTTGDWLLGLTVSATLNGATMTAFICGIGTVAGNSGTGLSTDAGTSFEGAPPTNDYNVTGIVLTRKLIASPQTFYAKVLARYSAGTPKYNGIFWARRMR